MDEFFVTDDPDAPRLSQKKRKRAQLAAKQQVAKRKKGSDDESDDGAIDDLDLSHHRKGDGSDSDASDQETAAEKRLRLAKRYIAKVREEAGAEEGEVDAADLDRDIIAQRLKNDALEAQGRLSFTIAEKYANVNFADPSRIRLFKSGKKLHTLSVTAVAVAIPAKEKLAPHGSKPIYVYSASKDAGVVKWDYWTGKKVHFVPGGLKLTKKISKAYSTKLISQHKGHRDEVLCLAASTDGQFVVSIVSLNLHQSDPLLRKVERTPVVIPSVGCSSTSSITSCNAMQSFPTSIRALSLDCHISRLIIQNCAATHIALATGGKDKLINIWSVKDDSHIATFSQHRDSVTGLAFRLNHNQLYSASSDRTIKLWNIDLLSYVETLYGHQDAITNIDALARERCVSTGSRDRTCRLWKIVEESQLIFRGGGTVSSFAAGEDLVVMDGLRKTEKQATQAGGSLDAIAMLDEEHFVSGSDTGAISLWNVNRKKPLFTKLRAHGPGSRAFLPGSDAFGIGEGAPAWITCLATVRYSDMFASGSGDGWIRLWKVGDGKKKFSLLACIPMTGFVNSLSFFEAPVVDTTMTSDQASKASRKDVLHLAVGVGQEHRLGRWWRDKTAKNGVAIVTLG
ncbi:WD40-repeat-containing domain protein [Gaertneriomyces semiglobifer]|nr:WD40-repeat-containing domain protein [Gaertneriomyces semiglobifer]